MNTFRTSVKINQSILVKVFFNALFYTFPTGMFLTACNCLYESVRRVYFDWLLVIIPTIVVFIIGFLYEILKVYRKERRILRKKKIFVQKTPSYQVSKAKLVTN